MNKTAEEILIEDVTPITITFTDRIATDGGMVTYTARVNGRMLGTIFGWRGEWTSAYSVDGRHLTPQSLATKMLAREFGL